MTDPKRPESRPESEASPRAGTSPNKALLRTQVMGTPIQAIAPEGSRMPVGPAPTSARGAFGTMVMAPPVDVSHPGSERAQGPARQELLQRTQLGAAGPDWRAGDPTAGGANYMAAEPPLASADSGAASALQLPQAGAAAWSSRPGSLPDGSSASFRGVGPTAAEVPTAAMPLSGLPQPAGFGERAPAGLGVTDAHPVSSVGVPSPLSASAWQVAQAGPGATSAQLESGARLQSDGDSGIPASLRPHAPTGGRATVEMSASDFARRPAAALAGSTPESGRPPAGGGLVTGPIQAVSSDSSKAGGHWGLMTMEADGVSPELVQKLKGSGRGAKSKDAKGGVPTRTLFLGLGAVVALLVLGATFLFESRDSAGSSSPALREQIAAADQANSPAIPAPSASALAPSASSAGATPAQEGEALEALDGKPSSSDTKTATPEPAPADGPVVLNTDEAAAAYLNGDYDKALTRYRRLATEYPQDPALSAMARIIASKVSAGGQQ